MPGQQHSRKQTGKRVENKRKPEQSQQSEGNPPQGSAPQAANNPTDQHDPQGEAPATQNTDSTGTTLQDVAPMVNETGEVIGTTTPDEEHANTDLQEEGDQHYGSSPTQAVPEDVREYVDHASFGGDWEQVGTNVPRSSLVERQTDPVMTGPTSWKGHEEEGEPEGKILGPTDPLEFEGLDMGATVVVTEDTYRKVYPGNSKRASYILLFRAGQSVSGSTVARINSNALSNREV